MTDFTAAAIAGQTFYRAVASPQRAGSCSYIQLYNPPDSCVRVLLDAVYVWPGLTVSGEYGILHYATPFNNPALSGIVLDVFEAEILPTSYNGARAKTRLFCGTYPDNIVPRVDYFFQGPAVGSQAILEKFPYPIAFAPGDGILLWNCTASHEGKAGFWMREVPYS